MTAPSSSRGSSPAMPRYHGLRGAAVYGLLCAACVIAVGLAGALVLTLGPGAGELALHFFARMALVGVVVGVGATFCRWICGATTDRLLSMRLIKGDLGALLFIPGLMLAGYFTTDGNLLGNRQEQRRGTGQPMEIAGPTLNGGEFSLANYRGKLVLVDCWASWCGPCIAEMPNVRAVYDRYHGDGLEVVGVSFDFKREDLEKFLKAHPEPWPQVFFSGKGSSGWENPIAKRYDIRSIPAIFLIDREGKLAARDLRGSQIDRAVALSLGKPLAWYECLFLGVLGSPWWLLIATVMGAAVLGGLLEAGVRRMFRKAPPLAATRSLNADEGLTAGGEREAASGPSSSSGSSPETPADRPVPR